MTARPPLRLFQVDAFTRTSFAGNAAGVILGAEGLSTETMQAIARELNNSETAFLFAPAAPDHDVFIRYFTPTVEVPIRNSETLNSIVPNLRAIERLTRHMRVNGLFAFTLRPDCGGDVLTEARMFASAIGIPEDPVTGNGNGPLGAYLAAEGVLPADGVHVFSSLQGRAMRRPGIVKVEVTTNGGTPETVRVGDEAVVVFETRYAA